LNTKQYDHDKSQCYKSVTGAWHQKQRKTKKKKEEKKKKKRRKKEETNLENKQKILWKYKFEITDVEL